MLRAILRHDVTRSLPVWLPVLSVNAGLCGSLLLGVAARKQAALPGTWLVLLGWFTVSVFFALSPIRRRCGALDLALPISARRLWTIHFLSVLLSAGAILAVYVAGVDGLARILGGRVHFTLGAPGLAALLGSGLLLAAVLVESFRPSLSRVPVTVGYVAWMAAVQLGILAILLWLSESNAAWSAVVVLLAAVAGWRLHRKIPAAYATAPAKPSRARTAESGASTMPRTDVHEPSGSRVLAVTLVRVLSLGGKELAAYPFAVLLGALLGGALAPLLGEPDAQLRLWNLPLAVYLLFAYVGPRLESLHLLDPLPVRRRPVLAIVLVPSFLAFCLGYGLGVLLLARASWNRQPVNYVETRDRFQVEVPWSAYRVAWDGKPPRIGSPWGEAYTPEPSAAAVFGSRAALYNPFSVGAESSREFVALQISRAVEAAYGAAIPPAEIAARYLETGSRGRVAAKEGGLALPRDYPALVPRGTGPSFALVLPLVAVPWLLLVAALLRGYRAAVPEWVRQAVYWGTLAGFLALQLSLAAAMMTRFVRPWVAEAVLDIAARRLGETPGAAVAAWVVCAVVLLAAYRVAESQFLKMEIPTRPSRYTLIGRRPGGE